MPVIPVNYYIFLSVALFAIGVVGVLTRRNAIIIFMCIELMLNAVNILLVAFSKMHHVAAYALDRTTTVGTEGQLFVFLSWWWQLLSHSGFGNYRDVVPEYTFC